MARRVAKRTNPILLTSVWVVLGSVDLGSGSCKTYKPHFVNLSLGHFWGLSYLARWALHFAVGSVFLKISDGLNAFPFGSALLASNLRRL